jgi:single-strand DNA-binding protein
MSKMFGLARLGRDAEIRTTSQGESVATLALAFSYGRKGSDGKRPTQWVDGALWGKRAEALAPYLLKGGLVSVLLEDVHIETYQGKNGEASKLVGRVVDVELAGGGERTASPAPAPRAAPAPRPSPSAGSGFDDMTDDVPFRDPMSYRGAHLVM